MAKKKTETVLDLDPETAVRDVLDLAFQPAAGETQIEQGDLYGKTIDDEMEIVKELVAAATKINMQIVRHLMFWRDSRLWEDARDDSGNEFPTWSEFLKWVCPVVGIHKATFHRGLKGVTEARALGLGWSDIEHLPPAKVEKAISLMSARDPETGLTGWSPEFVADAARAQVEPIEYARELLGLPKGQLLPAVRTSVKAPQPIVVRARETSKGFEVSAWQDDLFLGAFTADKKTSPEVIALFERKLNVTFFQED